MLVQLQEGSWGSPRAPLGVSQPRQGDRAVLGIVPWERSHCTTWPSPWEMSHPHEQSALLALDGISSPSPRVYHLPTCLWLLLLSETKGNKASYSVFCFS